MRGEFGAGLSVIIFYPKVSLKNKIFAKQKYLSKVLFTVSEAEIHVEKMEKGAGCLNTQCEFQRRPFLCKKFQVD